MWCTCTPVLPPKSPIFILWMMMFNPRCKHLGTCIDLPEIFRSFFSPNYITTHLLPIHRDYVWDSTRRASPVGLALTSTAVLSRSIRSCFPYLFGVIDVWKKVRVQCWINLLSVILLLLLSFSVSPPPVLPPCSFLFFFLVSSSSLHIH